MKVADTFVLSEVIRLTGAVLGAGLLILPSAAAVAGGGSGDDPVATSARAVTLEAGYSAEIMSVLRGGLREGTVYRGLTEAAADFDLAALAGAPPETLFRIGGLHPHGGGLSGTRSGDLQGASNIEAYNHPSLYELWLGGQLRGGDVVWRAGRLAADPDIATTEGGGVFLNSSFGWPAFISGNTLNTGPAFPRSALGLSARIELTDTLQVRTGVYDGDTFDDSGGDPSRHPGGFHLELNRRQGLFTVVEFARAWPGAPAVDARPGVFKLGLWRHTAQFADLRDPARLRPGNHGIYAVAEQTLWHWPGVTRDSPRRLTAFVRIGTSPDDRNFYSHTWDAGLTGTGLVPGRAADVVGLGVAVVRISASARAAGRVAGTGSNLDHEATVELSYRLVLQTHWQITPDVQWIRHPGGSARLPDAFVLGLRTRFTL